MTIVVADGQEVELNNSPGITALVHPGDMSLEVPGHQLIGPEETVKCANELEQDQWELIRVNEKFLGVWKEMWENVEPPLVLAKANLALRHIAGMILLMAKAQAEGVNVHLNFPETYLHPAQCRMIMSMLYKLQGKSNGRNDSD